MLTFSFLILLWQTEINTILYDKDENNTTTTTSALIQKLDSYIQTTCDQNK